MLLCSFPHLAASGVSVAIVCCCTPVCLSCFVLVCCCAFCIYCFVRFVLSCCVVVVCPRLVVMFWFVVVLGFFMLLCAVSFCFYVALFLSASCCDVLACACEVLFVSTYFVTSLHSESCRVCCCSLLLSAFGFMLLHLRARILENVGPPLFIESLI